MTSGEYELYSQTSSGWRISHNPLAPNKKKRWRAEHPKFGLLFSSEHDDLSQRAMHISIEWARQLVEKMSPEELNARIRRTR